MRLSEGVEWAVHACVLLAALPQGRTLPGAAIAEFLGVPPAYLAKHLQALSRAGLVKTSRGAAGGYRLAKAADEITFYEMTIAIEGDERAFRCQEIRQRGPAGAPKEVCRRPCAIAATYYAAESAWRAELEKVTIADMVRTVEGAVSGEGSRLGDIARRWLTENVR